MIAGLSIALLASCSNEPNDVPSQDGNADNAPTQATLVNIDIDDLVGEWCHERYEAGGEVSQEQITYIFKPDGSLIYQNSPTARLDRPGSYEITPGGLKLLPTFMMFDLKVIEATEESFVLSTGVDTAFYWTRGRCD